MLSERLQKIQRELKRYDKMLFVYSNKFGIDLVMRQADRLEASDYNQIEPEVSALHPQIIFALTDDWKPTGNPVPWGIEPVMERLKWMDSWRDPDMFRRMEKNNELCEDDESRQRHNNLRALAADVRPELKKAYGDYITRYMPAYDKRRIRDGSHKSQ